ncbi:hypothetical protein I544_0920 [Mycobacteroides abscessus subsp. bolletii 103]|nr:hypothetical protein I544_0920 [Mycobacteroides abscessus subsp. bolletii 103]
MLARAGGNWVALDMPKAFLEVGIRFSMALTAGTLASRPPSALGVIQL